MSPPALTFIRQVVAEPAGKGAGHTCFPASQKRRGGLVELRCQVFVFFWF